MDTTKDLMTREEALARLKELAENIRICMFCTQLDSIPFSTRPMSLQEVDEEGCLWFLSSLSSEKDTDIRQDEKVQLIFSQPSSARFLSVYGHADLYKDRSKIEELWHPMAKAWFKEGKEDPDISVIRVRPEDCYYWDTGDGKVLSGIKIALAALTGKTPDSGEQGAIQL